MYAVLPLAVVTDIVNSSRCFKKKGGVEMNIDQA